MKKKTFFIFFVMLSLFGKEAMAQLPATSSSTNPKWYYIQVTGDGDRANRVFTAEETCVSGRSLNADLLDQQLWRFELSGGNYVIVNKAEGKKLDIYYDGVRGINHAILSDSPSTLWKLEVMTSNPGYNITATVPPSEKTSAIYAHQANTGGSRNYVIMFETSTWKSGLNSTFNFVEYYEEGEAPDFYPQVSTADSPLWYYIQGKGEGDRANRVYTVEEDMVYGRAFTVSEELSELDKQLWRFERSGDSYVIINKATGKKLDVAYNDARSITVAAVNDVASTGWLLEESATEGYFNIKATTPLADRPTYVYSHQANNYDSRNYAVMLETSGWKSDASSLFKFIYCEYPVPEISTSGKEVWYSIVSQKPGFESRVITDVTDQNLSNVKLSLDAFVSGDYTQQWKIVEMSNSEVQFVNRATGNMIQTEAEFNSYFYALSAPFNSNANGWTMQYLGSSQYEMNGFNTAGSQVHMNAASDDAEADIYLTGNNRDSGFAWTFQRVVDTASARAEQVVTGIDNEQPVTYRIGVNERKIYVYGADNYTVRNISGVTMNPSAELPVGVYLVTIDGKTTKILVK
ncbi:MAG: RICIN domain-containing protein [Bacteroidales bacterium]|nr:RICIN domain-containing protein [Bacteroidales bacterium]